MECSMTIVWTGITLGLALLEGWYSLKFKRDGVYRRNGFFGNLLRGVILLGFSGVVVSFYFSVVYPFLPQSIGSSGKSIAMFLPCLLLVDFLWYCFHRLHHAISCFWALHSVHHGDSQLNLSTAFRISWTEQIYLFWFYFPALVIGFHPIVFFGAILYLNLHQFFCHSQYIKLPRFFDLLFITPRIHRIHHDQVEKHQQSNFGAVFSLWDRLFGTYVDEIPSFTPGIKGYEQDNFIKMETDPIKEYFRIKSV